MSRTLYASAQDLLAKARGSGAGAQRIRLLGVRLEGLVAADEVTEQLELGAQDSGPGWREAQGAVDRAVERFGMAAVRPAALLDRPERV
jgi:DNA polymerase-4